MTIRQIIAYQEFGGHGVDLNGLQPIPTVHPPSLRRPQKVKIPTAQSGWDDKPGTPGRRRAERDLSVIRQRVMRQVGKPVVVQQVNYPVYPGMMDVTP